MDKITCRNGKIADISEKLESSGYSTVSKW